MRYFVCLTLLFSLLPASAENVALNRPVISSVPQEGDARPALAVDGKTDAYWAGAGLPAELVVDLGSPIEIESVHTTFFSDGRYYQYTVDVSTDKALWTPVVDESKTVKPSPPDGQVEYFAAPVLARFVRLTVLKNSVNGSVHVREFAVYKTGTTPKPQGLPQEFAADSDGFTPLFNGRDLTGWKGAKDAYQAIDGKIVLEKGGGVLHTVRQYADFVLRFEFLLTPGANNGLGIRYPGHGDAAYTGMELQILDNEHPKYAKLQPHQYHGSIYGIALAKRGFLKPTGEWNVQEVVADGSRIKVTLNGEVIVDVDLATSEKAKQHQGAQRTTGHIGFLGHGDHVEFRNIRIKKVDNRPPPGFTALFNGKDLRNWKGLVGNPEKRAQMAAEQLAVEQAEADTNMRAHWKVENGELVFDGKGQSLCTAKDYANFELYVDWKMPKNADSGIYLRGSPQIQIWDPDNPAVQNVGAGMGSGALWNNQKSGNRPLVRADNPIGQWNTFHIEMIGERVTVHLNQNLVLNDVVMENYWERDKPIYASGQIELQNHGNTLYFKNIFIKELPVK